MQCSVQYDGYAVPVSKRHDSSTDVFSPFFTPSAKLFQVANFFDIASFVSLFYSLHLIDRENLDDFISLCVSVCPRRVKCAFRPIAPPFLGLDMAMGHDAIAEFMQPCTQYTQQPRDIDGGYIVPPQL